MVIVPKINDWYGAKEIFQIMEKQYGDEKFIFSIDEGKIESFLEQRGLKVIDHLENSALENKFLTREDGSLIGHMMAAYCVVSAMPK
ncbi:hypothetical protein D1AOALGA4SA_12741 [Olavius algarvensis Delta 1 endosymbiont]|nr:hypothetical protein D1AOALGA4SA_12741 [Olavius algarvensis Delta 1 endosymbiont]